MPLIQRNGITTSFRCGGDIRPNRIVKFGADDGHVVEATSAADFSLGVSYIPDSVDDPYPIGQERPEIKLVEGDTVDVVMSEYPRVLYGGVVERGAPVTSDAQGRAVTAAAGNQILGYAGITAAEGVIGPVVIFRSVHP